MPSNGPGTGTRLWTPRDGPYLPAAWWDAADTSTILPGSTFTWLDKSGNGKHATQGTAAAQPTTGIRTTPSGRNVLDFDAGDFLATVNLGGIATGTVFVAGKADSLAGTWFDGTTGRWLLYSNAGTWRTYAGGAGDLSTGSATTSPVVFTCFFAGNTTSYSRVSGVPGSPGDIGNNTLSVMNIGANLVGASNLDGYIAEFLIYPFILPVPFCATVETYLAAKSGFPLSYAACSPPLVFA